ncbi:MAG: LysR substrate-binding domain-containing protein [Flavobacteriales bacterium]|nr:LysR substrate-binding domain-containing protein [Flavobacteriales bacterium]
MTITQLKYVLAVDTYRHFAEAAESCFVTQPTLSMQINKLEKELDVLIFDRSKHPVEPTDIGKQIIKQARVTIQEAQRIEEMVKGSKGVIAGEFRLGIIPTVSTNLLPRFLKVVMEKYPEIELKIEELQTEQIIEKLDRGQIDAGILATPLDKQDIIEKPLYYEPFMAYVPQGHRLEGEEFVLHSELNLNDMLLLKNGHCFRDSVINLCSSAFPEGSSQHKSLEFQSGNFETLIRLANSGFGMTLLPYLMAVDLSEEERQYIKPIEHPQPTREISIIYSKVQLKLSIIELLAEQIKSQLPPKLLKPQDQNVVNPTID